MNAHSAVSNVRLADLADATDRQRIADLLGSFPDAQPFHRLEWIEAVQRGCGQRARMLIAERGLLPLNEIRSPLFGTALVSSGFAVGGGILAHDSATSRALADAAWALAESVGCTTAELRGGPLPEGWSANTGTYAAFAKPLESGEDAILQAIPRKQRAEVRRALGFDLETRAGRSGRDRDDHYRVYSESVRNLGTPVFPRALFDAVLEGFGEDTDILTISRDGKALASVLSIYHRGTVYPYWGGGTWGARAARANELLYFRLMCHAAGRGCTRFDFGRSKIGTGAFSYKKNWGFEPEPLIYAARTRHGAPPRDINPLSAKYKLQVAMWQRLPLWLANRVGPILSRGLG